MTQKNPNDIERFPSVFKARQCKLEDFCFGLPANKCP